ncbi:TfoX/Sxy family protein [Methylobacterium sp. J-088]|uniref:TfoX/Sxy family protein n=1 Tax=unclassified Methylobacterium TaxID=2615210 RepID=UPI001FBBFB6F|nr:MULTISPECIES: TfoX/Sxy family protein [unclassified Methylobacterium]MCJ2064443.1 TfoX/Sxy family protein [Methylobacterium sp. J-088]
MATKQSSAEFIVEQIGGAGHVTARKIFGEYGLYCDGKLVGLVCDERLFVKPTAAGRAYLGSVTEAAPYPGAKPCFLIAGEAWDDADWLMELIKRTAAELPIPAAKKAGRRRVRALP